MAQTQRTITIKITADMRQFHAQLIRAIRLLAEIDAQRKPWRADYAEVE